MPSDAFTLVVDFLRNDSYASVRDDLSAQELRARMAADSGAMAPPAGVVFDAAPVGGVAALWARPAGADDSAVVLYLHGGGYVIGSPDSHRNITARLALALGHPVCSLDYRLAPEHPHPAASDDALAAYRAIVAGGVDPARIVLAGDSAGGGLALATLVRLRDEGDPLPAAGVGISPWTDIAMTGESMQTKADVDPMVQAPGLGRMAEWFIGGGDPKDPYASPLYADLAGLPPLLVQVGECETLLDDATRFAARAEAAGVDVILHVHPDMIHVFPVFCGLFPEADAGLDEIVAFVRAQIDAGVAACPDAGGSE